MAHETKEIVKRTIWEAKCPHDRHIILTPGPKERFCAHCNKWIPYREKSWEGPSLKRKNQ